MQTKTTIWAAKLACSTFALGLFAPSSAGAQERAPAELRGGSSAIAVTEGASEIALRAALESHVSSCLRAEVLAPEVARWLGRDTIDGRIAMTLRAVDDSRELELQIVRDGEVVAARSFRPGDASCEVQIERLGLIIALAIEATILPEAQPDEEAAAEPDDGAPGAPDNADSGAPEDADSSAGGDDVNGMSEGEVGLRVAVSADVVGAVDVLPGPSLGGALGASLEPLSWLSVVLTIGAMTNGSLPVREGEVTMTLASGAAALCAMASLPPVRLGGCFGASAGAFVASGSGFAPSNDAILPRVSLDASLPVRVALTSEFGLQIIAGGAVPVVAPEVAVLSDTDEVVALIGAPAVGAQLALGAYGSWD